MNLRRICWCLRCRLYLKSNLSWKSPWHHGYGFFFDFIRRFDSMQETLNSSMPCKHSSNWNMKVKEHTGFVRCLKHARGVNECFKRNLFFQNIMRFHGCLLQQVKEMSTELDALGGGDARIGACLVYARICPSIFSLGRDYPIVSVEGSSFLDHKDAPNSPLGMCSFFHCH